MGYYFKDYKRSRFKRVIYYSTMTVLAIKLYFIKLYLVYFMFVEIYSSYFIVFIRPFYLF